MARSLLLCTIFTLCIHVSRSITITTKLGEIEGATASNGINKFLNLPYAEPPIGALRWRPTVPLKNTFTGVYNATAFGNACIQPSAVRAFNVDPDRAKPILYTEDCLYLNVYTPYNFAVKESQPLLPVLFWIHGGGLTLGTSMVPMYDGSKLAKDQNIIVVSINYRLGRAAWLIDPALDDSPTGNGGANGFLDMIQALKWTRHHIESFGGDKHQITISGESGGGWAVCGLVLSPLAKGLFKRSIQMSGSCIKSMGRFRSKRETYAMNKKIREVIGVKSFEELRSMDMQEIIDAGFGNYGIVDGPSVDGYVFPTDTIELISKGHVNGESSMIGTVFQESFCMAPFYMGVLSKTEEDLNEFYRKYLFDSEVKEIKKYYPINELKKIWSLEKSFFNTTTEIIQATQHTDCWVRCGSIAQTEIIANNPITKNVFPVYFYQFGTFQEPYDAVTHGYDIGAMFDMMEPKYSPFPVPENVTVYTDEFIKVTMKWIGEYVKGIGPLNNDGKPATVQNGNYLRIVEEMKVIDLKELDAVKERCKLWDMWGDESIDNWPICFGVEAPHNATQEFMENIENPANDTTDCNASDNTC